MTEPRVMHFWMEHDRPEELSWTSSQFANLCGYDKHGLQANWTSTVEDVTCVKCKEKLKKLHIHYWRNTYSRVGDILKLSWPTDDQKMLCNKFSDFFTESEESVTCPDCRAYIEKANSPRHWNGMCLANKHGLDYEEQNCDQCMVDAGIKSTPALQDAVNKPAHYNAGKVECIDALEAATTGLTGIEAVCTANAIKYLWRWKLKNGAEDLKKAKWYLERLIKKVEDKS